MHEQSPYDPRRFVSLCHRDEPCGPAFEQAFEPASLCCGFASRMPDHCGGTQHEQSAQVAITLFGDPALALFAAAAVIGPTPGIVASRRLASLSLCRLTIATSSASSSAANPRSASRASARHVRRILS